ncbi:MAG: carbamoyltransferase HypF, partial [Gammaproteobacteria bacterium]|nr:carbamoyltransferase HypF [Gammaproteobacteria bacterium]
MKSPTTKRVGWCITVEGVVQGVGFRPTVWNLAHQYQLSGSVWNDAAGVTIEVWGGVTQLASFLQQLEQHPPPLAIITHLHTTTLPEEESTSIPTQFTIVESRGGTVTTAVAADAATCSDCLADILEPENRRYGYPFTNCTHCGPRLSIIEAIPYDRRNTSMSHFTLCPNCLQEYEDPASRRFHAQPNCCPKCGPALWLEQAEEKLLPGDPITISAQLIESGAIIAIKGLGGFHLACDATNEAAVSRLRQRKLRPTKALAVMAKDCAAISPYAVITEQAKHALESRSAPIVILEQREQGKTVAPSIAPGQQSIGFMLPYTPLHHLLMAQLETPIVLTSGNRSQEPQCISNQAAREQLSGIVDYWLLHDRKIINRVDDAVVREAGGEIRTLRYGRGMAPQTLSLPPGFNSSPPLLAMGGMLKNSFALLRESGITLSQYIGDLENPASIHEYQKSLQRYNHLFEHHPEAIVVDRHPDYLSTQLGRRWSAEQRLPLFEVQHHHAHIASCMVEHHLALNHPPLLGIALDGLGYG